MMKTTTKRVGTKVTGQAVCVIFLATLVAGFTAVTAISILSGNTAKSVIPYFTEDHLPNETAADWVTYADYVVVVTATSERAVEAPLDPGAPETTLGRDVTLTVDDTLWARNAEAEAPSTVRWSAGGWGFTADEPGIRHEMVEVGAPRIEVGHSYVIAIKWELPLYTQGPDKETAQWRGLGGGSVLPFDAGVVGNGEFEGEVRTVKQAIASVERGAPEQTFANMMLGESGSVLARKLGETESHTNPQDFRPTPRCD
jgi:hypothetical protein